MQTCSFRRSLVSRSYSRQHVFNQVMLLLGRRPSAVLHYEDSGVLNSFHLRLFTTYCPFGDRLKLQYKHEDSDVLEPHIYVVLGQT